MEIALPEVWRAAALILGLQLGGFTWRVKRELETELQEQRVWIPPADFLNLVALVVVVVGVFLWPILGLPGGAEFAGDAFGLALILLLGYPFAIASHYGLLRPRGRPVAGWQQSWSTATEWTVIGITVATSAGYVVLAVLTS